MATKEVRELLAKLKAQGWRVEPTKRGHFAAYAPSGRGIVHIAGTPGDVRSLKKTVSQLRRFGYKD